MELELYKVTKITKDGIAKLSSGRYCRTITVWEGDNEAIRINVYSGGFGELVIKDIKEGEIE